MINTELKVDGTLVLVVAALGVLGYAFYKKSEIVESISQGTNLTSDNNYINRTATHLLGLDEQGYGNLGSWFYCLTNSKSAVCPK